MIALAYILMLCGAFFILTTIIGLARTKDNFQMLHIAAINDMLGVPLFLLGAVIYCFSSAQILLGLKILLLIFLIYIMTPIAGYIVVKILFFIKKNNVHNE